MKRLVVAALTLLIAAAPMPGVPPSEIAAENARWTSLGVKLPPGGIVSTHPYSAPYSVHSFVVPTAWYRQFDETLKAKGDVPVAASDLRKDLPVLKFLMERTYAGYATAKSRYAWDWNRWFAAWDASLAKRGSQQLPLDQAFAPWGKLEDVQLDNHSGISGYMKFTSGSQSAQLAETPAGACSVLKTSSGSYRLSASDKGQQPHPVQVWNGSALARGSYVSYPKREGAPRSLTCGGKTVALTAIGAGTAPADASYETLADGIAYVRMPQFTDAALDTLRTSLSKATNLGKERAVILDLRGNGGGNAPTDVLSNWFAQSAVDQAAQLKQIGTESCFREALFFGLQQQLASGLKAPVSTGTTAFLQQVADLLKSQVSCSVTPAISQSGASLSDHKFEKQYSGEQQTRVIAVVDSGCGSDCEYMAAILGSLPGTVIAGSSTYGVMGFTQPGYFVLPHTRVPFRLALSRTDAYGDGRSVDGYGVTVDVLLPNAASQDRASLLALARSLI
ncbi:MAG TPA: S41 family peptidase [Candidatus Baltobacteraceae bacterium]|nr:S41 family peptidase [Candidatus Baltobacteraceae bacterium]